MPSPTNADKFLDEAFEVSMPGTKITLYGIAKKESLFTDYTWEVKLKAYKNNFEVNIDSKRIVSDYSPAQKKIALDFKIK